MHLQKNYGSESSILTANFVDLWPGADFVQCPKRMFKLSNNIVALNLQLQSSGWKLTKCLYVFWMEANVQPLRHGLSLVRS